MAIFSKKEDNQAPAAASGSVPQSLLGPRVSEKAGRLAESGKYVFNVALRANKVEIKKAVEREYKVNVIQVNLVTNPGKSRRYGSSVGKTSPFKKAIVTLKQGQRIEGAVETA